MLELQSYVAPAVERNLPTLSRRVARVLRNAFLRLVEGIADVVVTATASSCSSPPAAEMPLPA